RGVSMNPHFNTLIVTSRYRITLSIYNKVKISPELKGIPVIPFFEYTKRHYIKKDPFKKTLRELFLPIIEEKGIARVFDVLLQNWVIYIAKPEYFKEVMHKDDTLKFDSKKRPMSEFEFNYIGHSNMLFVNGDEHRRHRKTANPAFHRGWSTELFGNLALDLFKEMDKMIEKNPKVDVVALTQRYTLDVLGRTTFEYDFNAISNNMSSILDAYNSVMKAMANTTYLIFPILEKIPGFKRTELMKKLDLINEFLAGIVDEKIQKIESSSSNNNNKDNNNDDKDLLTLMLEAQRNESGKYILSKDEIMNDLKLFFLAGHDTTSTALSCAIAYLGMHPEYQNKARQEVLNVMSGDGVNGCKPDAIPTSDQLKEMKLVNMIINETLRLHPPASTTGLRVAQKKFRFGEFIIPETIYLQHLSSTLYKNPLTFLPERFDTSSNEATSKLIPFGGGSRICIGMNLSLAEQKTLLAMLLNKYEWTLPNDTIHKNDFIEVYRTYLSLM
ncbi:8738_t:CDS:10, partial [Entrophospora sp. SA101]